MKDTATTYLIITYLMNNPLLDFFGAFTGTIATTKLIIKNSRFFLIIGYNNSRSIFIFQKTCREQEIL